MFDKKPPQYHFETLNPEFKDFIDRTDRLEQSTKRLTRLYDRRQLEWSSHVSSSKRRIGIVRKELEDIQSEIKGLRTVFMNLVFELKMTVEGEKYAQLKDTIDQWPLEQYITREEFMRMIKEQPS